VADPVTPAPVAADPAAPPADPAAPADPAPVEDWRKPFATDADGNVDEKQLAELNRLFAAPSDFAKTFRDNQTALRNKQEGMVKLPGADATEEDLAAFNKSLGVPEKPDGYKNLIAPPEGLELGEADKQFLDGLTAKLHEKGGFLATEEGQNAARQFYYDMYEEQAAQMAAAAVLTKQTTEKNLKADWGAEFKINNAYAKEAIRAHAPVESARELLDIPLADGSKLGDQEVFVRFCANAGRATTEDTGFLQDIISGESLSVSAAEDRLKTLQAYRDTDPKKYAEVSAPGGEIQRLKAQIERSSGR
tara:strand:- start:9448 stop:10362 length:915 start_codon:yes stop_codon:yes gene_type:complete